MLRLRVPLQVNACIRELAAIQHLNPGTLLLRVQRVPSRPYSGREFNPCIDFGFVTLAAAWNDLRVKKNDTTATLTLYLYH